MSTCTNTACLKSIVKPFYTKCLTVNEDGVEKVAPLLSHSNLSTFLKQKVKLIGQFFWKLIPNLKWDVQEML